MAVQIWNTNELEL